MTDVKVPKLDENDLLQAGALPSDPFADTSPMTDPGLQAFVDALGRNSFASSADDFVSALEARRLHQHKPIATPWPSLNSQLGGGLWPGQHFLVGGTGTGKSQFAMQLGLNAAEAGVPVLYVALELAPLDLFARAVALSQRAVGVRDKWSEYWLGEKPLPQGDAGPVESLKRLPFHWSVGMPMTGWSYKLLEVHARAMRALYPDAHTVFIIVDFVQLLGGDERELRERIGRAAYMGRAIARESNATMLMLSSVARDFYASLSGEESPRKSESRSGLPMGEGNPARFVGLGKESGEVEFSADTVFVLGSEKWEDGKPPPDGTHIHLAIAKIRARPANCTGWVQLRFDGSMFSEPSNGRSGASERPSLGDWFRSND